MPDQVDIDAMVLKIRREVDDLNELVRGLKAAGIPVTVKIVMREKTPQVAVDLSFLPRGE